ncbi:MAG: glycosyltransferase family 2 protein [Armatimonadota bacterium]
MQDVGALVVTWNRKDDLLECVESLYRAGCHAVYVVDNASTDGTSEAVAADFPDARLIRSEENLGFAAGNNLGLAAMLDDGLDAVFLVNDDAVVSEDALQHLLRRLSESGAGAVAPKILLYSQPEIIWSAGGEIDDTGAATQRLYAEPDGDDAPADVDYAVGCAMLARSAVVRQVGFFDARYFTYFEEADWCRRVRSAGYRVLYEPAARVFHKVDLTTNGRNSAAYYFARNRLLYLRSAGVGGARIGRVAASLLRMAAGHARRGKVRDSRLVLRGVADYYLGRFGRLA